MMTARVMNLFYLSDPLLSDIKKILSAKNVDIAMLQQSTLWKKKEEEDLVMCLLRC